MSSMPHRASRFARSELPRDCWTTCSIAGISKMKRAPLPVCLPLASSRGIVGKAAERYSPSALTARPWGNPAGIGRVPATSWGLVNGLMMMPIELPAG